MEEKDLMESTISEIIECINSNQLEQALELILENEERLKDNSGFWNAKAVLCIKAGEYDVAIECLKNVLQLDAENADAYYNLAYVCEQKGIYSDAAVYYGYAEKYSNDVSLIGELREIYTGNSILNNIKNTVAQSKRKTFIVLSSCGWGDVLQRMHHISRSLVKFGQEVFYVSSTEDITLNSETVTLSTFVEYIIENKRIVDGVEVFQPLNASFNGRYLFSSYTAVIQRLVDSRNGINDVVIVAYMPYQVEVIKAVKGNYKVIYECVDDHSDLEYAFWGNKKDIVWEQELMDMADAITTTATSLYLQRISVEHRKNVYLSRNAVNEVDFMFDDEEMPEDLKYIPEPRIVYTGAIYNWFDINLFYDVVRSNPDKSFVIIGFGETDLFSEKYDNLYFLGAKKHSELKRYLKYMQVGIIPFKDNTDIIINCDPIKQYEYIACRLPVITTFMPESAIDKINTFLANTKDEFNKAIEECLNIQIDRCAVADFLLQNSWNSRVALLCRIADNKVDSESISAAFPILEKRLAGLAEISDHSNFFALYSLALNIEDKLASLAYSKKAFKKANTKYIEQQYLYALYVNGKYEDFVNTVTKSQHIKPYLVSELLYRRDIDDIEALEIVMLYCLKCYNKAKELSYKLDKLGDRSLFVGFYHYLFEENHNALDCIQSIYLKSSLNAPLYKYLRSCFVKFTIDESKFNLNNTDFKGNAQQNYSVTVLIPTRNRPILLERCVDYFNSISDKRLAVNIFILDASDTEIKEMNKDMLNRYDQNRVKHWEFDKDSTAYFRINSVINYISDEFFCYCADDDFLYKNGLIKSIKIMKDNNEIVSVKGKSYVFLNNDMNIIYDFPKDFCENMIDDCPFNRLHKLLQNWVPQLSFLVFRKNDITKIVRNFFKNNADNDLPPVFLEYLWYFYIPLYGKIVNIDEPLNIRDFNLNSASYTTPGFYQYIEDGSFNKYYYLFKRCLIDFSENTEQIRTKLSMSFDELMRIFLVKSWNIPSEYVRVLRECEFDIDLLKKWNENVNYSLK